MESSYQPPNHSARSNHLDSEKTGIILCSGAGVGFVAAVSIALIILPWNGASTGFEWTCFSFDLLSACAYGATSVLGWQRLDTPLLTPILVALVVSCAVHLLAGLGLVYSMFNLTTKQWMRFCSGGSEELTLEECQGRLTTMHILFPFAQLILPICGGVMCYYIYLYNSRPYYERASSDVPPGWEVPPAAYALDSSESDSEMDSRRSLAGQRQMQMKELGRNKKTGRNLSWSYKDFQEAKVRAQGSGNESRGGGIRRERRRNYQGPHSKV
ncbi:hypothetical protein T439DRAFT_322233 [Meredithblackwellia eburnea MCA 4105]